MNSKLESAVNARHIHDISDSRTDELKIQLQKCINERNDLEIKMEEAKQDTGLCIIFLYLDLQCVCLDLLISYNIKCFREKRYQG